MTKLFGAITFAGLALCWGAAPLLAQATPPSQLATVLDLPADGDLPDNLKNQTYRLWPTRAPGAIADAADETPTLTVYRPHRGHANGTAVIIAPGGGYVMLAAVLEGVEPAAWFTAHGVTAFVLTYRIGDKARLPIPLYDGARSIRFVRAHAGQLHVDSNRIGMMGFSAGGHLAAMTAVAATAGDQASSDLVERASSRPDFLILGYPWLAAAQLGADGNSPYCTAARLRRAPTCRPRDYAAFTPSTLVTERTPPTFIYHTTDDGSVPVNTAIDFYRELVAHKIPAELHVFESGRHGSGLGGASPALSSWPNLMGEWMRSRGFIGQSPASKN